MILLSFCFSPACLKGQTWYYIFLYAELISPEDLLQACSLWEKFDVYVGHLQFVYLRAWTYTRAGSREDSHKNDFLRTSLVLATTQFSTMIGTVRSLDSYARIIPANVSQISNHLSTH